MKNIHSQKIMREHTKYPRLFKRTLGIYNKALITKDFVFYCDYKGSDENANVEMYKRLANGQLELLSNNNFASDTLHEVLGTESWDWISQTMYKSYKHAKSRGYFEEYA